jgi:alkaline phosphatase D
LTRFGTVKEAAMSVPDLVADIAVANDLASGPLRSGPMLGRLGQGTAQVWARARGTHQLTLTVYSPTHPSHVVTTLHATPKIASACCVVFQVDGLDAGHDYPYTISSTDGTTARHTLRCAPATTARRARIVFGSCMRYWAPATSKASADANGKLPPSLSPHIFASMAGEQPDILLLTGDNSYWLSGEPLYPAQTGESSDPAQRVQDMTIRLRYRNYAPFRAILPSLSTVAIWDDHDYGADNSYAANSVKQMAQADFDLVWAQRDTSDPGYGIATTVRYGPVELFLTDGRWFRARDGENTTILGTNQLRWLQHALRDSDAPVKVVVSGSVVFPHFVTGSLAGHDIEGWRIDANPDLKELKGFIDTNDIRGVVFLSGDLHVGYLLHYPGLSLDGGAKRGPDFWEAVSSPLLNDAQPSKIRKGSKIVYDPGVIDELTEQNYGLLDVDLDRSGQEIALAIKTAAGQLGVQRHASLATLRVRAADRRLRAAVLPSGRILFIRGDRYAIYDTDQAHGGADPGVVKGYPKPLADLGATLENGIDGGLTWTDGQAYLFSGNGWVRYDEHHDKIVTTPRYVSDAITGIWLEGVDAALISELRLPYLFRDTTYVRVTPVPGAGLRGEVDAGYPLPIAGNWHQLASAFPDGIDAAGLWPNGKAYFFKDDKYVRYSFLPVEGVDAGYPKPIAGHWPGLEEL